MGGRECSLEDVNEEHVCSLKKLENSIIEARNVTFRELLIFFLAFSMHVTKFNIFQSFGRL